MKKVLTWILIAALLISCCGCTSINRLLGKTEEEAAPAAGVFPDGVTICGADVSGMTPAEAAEAVAARGELCAHPRGRRHGDSRFRRGDGACLRRDGL